MISDKTKYKESLGGSPIWSTKIQRKCSLGLARADFLLKLHFLWGPELNTKTVFYKVGVAMTWGGAVQSMDVIATQKSVQVLSYTTITSKPNLACMDNFIVFAKGTRACKTWSADNKQQDEQAFWAYNSPIYKLQVGSRPKQGHLPTPMKLQPLSKTMNSYNMVLVLEVRDGGSAYVYAKIKLGETVPHAYCSKPTSSVLTQAATTLNVYFCLGSLALK